MKFRKYFERHPFLTQFWLLLLFFVVVTALYTGTLVGVGLTGRKGLEDFYSAAMSGLILTVVGAWPVTFCLFELLQLIFAAIDARANSMQPGELEQSCETEQRIETELNCETEQRIETELNCETEQSVETKKSCETAQSNRKMWVGLYEFSTFLIAVIYYWLYLGFIMEVTFKDWEAQLFNSEMHTPIFSGSIPTFVTILLVAVAGLAFLYLTNAQKMPPLTTVLALGALYMGVIYLWIFTYHLIQNVVDVMLLVLPLSLTFITARVVICKVREYDSARHTDKPGLAWCNRVLHNSRNWPWLAFLAMWPLLGLIILILIPFGQTPDAFIKAFTETADFNLSTKQGPQNIYMDEHYLCTVAAGGDPKVVHPLRKGYRHGHEVIVNRQLCVANAFEQILEERTPRFHRLVRNFYDNYGFPVAKLIKTPLAADITYFIMKPLEWFFLLVLYLTDVDPENRIAMQYTGQNYQEFKALISKDRPTQNHKAQ